MKKLFALVLAFVLMGSMTACKSRNLPALRVGVLASYYSAAIYYADAIGYDTLAGIDLQLVEYASGAPMNESFAAGELDLADMGPAAVHAVGKYGAKVIAQNARQVAVHLMVSADSPLLSAEDESGIYGSARMIRGMTFMGPSGTYAHYLIIGYLDHFGLTMDDIHYVDMQYPQALEAFERGECDVCCMQNPNVFDASYASLGSPQDIAPMYENLICSGAAYDESFDALVRALSVIYRAQEDFLADDDLAAKWLSEYYAKEGYGASQEAVMEEIQKQKPLLSLKEAAAVPVGESLADAAVFMQSLGLISQEQADAVKANAVTDVLKVACDLAGIQCGQ